MVSRVKLSCPLHPVDCLPPDLPVLVTHHGENNVLRVSPEGVSVEDLLSCLAVSSLRQVTGQLHQVVEVSTSILDVGVVPVPEPAREAMVQHHFDQPHQGFAGILGPGVEAQDPDTTGDPATLDQGANGLVDQLIWHDPTLHSMAVLVVGQLLVPAELVY